MKCVVTGGAGFIGSNLVDALVMRGDRVTIIDDLSTGKRENLAGALVGGAELHVADVRDPVAVATVCEAVRPEVVFHLAAQVDVRRSVEHPAADAATNILGTISVLEAALAAGARRLINTSTCAVYGDADALPTPEEYPARPLAPYGHGKLSAERYCEWFARARGLSTISLRYSNVYGPRQPVHGEGGVVAIFCGRLLQGHRLVVFGDGQQTRDWVEVSDVVRANLIAAGSEVTGAVNVSTGHETSVLDLLTSLEKIRGAAPNDPEFRPVRPGEIRRSCLDPGRARRDLGWEAVVDLQSGVRRLLERLQP